MRSLISLACVVCCGVVVSGCGDPTRVRYVDPNPPSAYDAGATSSSSEPFVRHGADAAATALAIHELGGAIRLVELVGSSAPDDQARAASFLRDNVASKLVPALKLHRPMLAAQLARSLTRIDSARTPAERADALTSARALIDGIRDALIPLEARQDAAFRAGVLAELVNDAATEVESTGLDGSSANIDAYWTAQASLIAVRTDALKDAPASARDRVADGVAAQLASWFSRPTRVPTTGASRVAEQLRALADEIVTAGHIDLTMPPPDQRAPATLRALHTSIVAAVETARSGDQASAIAELHRAARGDLANAGPSIAAIDPELLVRLQRGVIVELPAAIKTGRDLEVVAASIDEQLDETVGAIEDELELLRQAE